VPDSQPLPPLPPPVAAPTSAATATQSPSTASASLEVLAYARANSERPGILQAAGIMSIVFGGLGVFLNLCDIAQSIMPFVMSRIMASVQATGSTTLPANPFANLPVAPMVLNAVMQLACMALAIYLIMCGILVLRDHKDGRRHHLRYAAMKFALALPVAAADAWSTYTMQAAMLANMPPSAGPGVTPMLLAAGAAKAAFWLVVSLAYPVAVAIVMRLAQVRAYSAYLAEMSRY
jgi:hypothetical protein